MRRCVVALLACSAGLGLDAGRLVQSEPIRSAPTVAGLPAADILTIVRSSGFAPAGRPVRRPGVSIVRALDPSGQAVDLTLDARSGRVLTVRPAGALRPPPVYGMPQPTPRRGIVFGLAPSPYDDPIGFEDATGALPPPPRGIPSAKPAAASAIRSAAVLPLPRPRPAAPAVAWVPAAASAPAVVAAPEPAAQPSPSAVPLPTSTMPPVTPLE